MDNALGYEPGDRSSILLGGTTTWPRNSEAEYRLDKAGVDISKLSVATIFILMFKGERHETC